MNTKRSMVVVMCATLLLVAAVSAEVPHLISYQGRLLDSEGSPVADGDHILTFQIVEHDPLPLGESPLWSSGPQTVTTTDGLFYYYLGSNVSLPPEIFDDDGVESYYLRIHVEGSALFMQGTRLVTVPFSVRSIYSDTAAYALAGPGGGGTNGWIDEGSVVHTESSGDNVGIGTSSPTDKLVVGGNLGSSIDDNFIVTRNGQDTYSGFRLGFNNDNYGWMRWYSYDGFIDFGTRQTGTNYLSTLVMNQGNVGINQAFPSEPLVVGNDLGSFNGNRIVVGDVSPATYTGIMMGEDHDNRGYLSWSIDDNYFDIGVEDEGTQWQMIKMQDGEIKVGTGSGNSSVQLPNDAVSSAEILNEAGLRSTARTSQFIINENWNSIVSTNISFPAAGYAIIIATAELRYTKYDNVTSPMLEFTITDFSGVGPHVYSYGCEEATSIEIFHKIVTIHEVFAVSEGANLFTFMAKVASGFCCSSVTNDARLTVIYVPTVYPTGVYGAADDETSGGTGVPLQPTVFSTAIPAADQMSNGSPGADEVTALRADFERQLQALRDEFQNRLEELGK